MSTKILIRELTESDCIESLTKLINESYRERANAGYNMTGSYQDSSITRHRIDSGICFLAEYDGEIIGTALLVLKMGDSYPTEYKVSGVAVLSQVCVKPGHRKLGIGALLIAEVEKRAIELGRKQLMLDTVETEPALVEYYRRFGFQDFSHFQWEGKTYRSLIMEKSLVIE